MRGATCINYVSFANRLNAKKNKKKVIFRLDGLQIQKSKKASPSAVNNDNLEVSLCYCYYLYLHIKYYRWKLRPFYAIKLKSLGTRPELLSGYYIVKAHSGEIKVKSIEGEYTEFVVLLPV